MGVGGRHRAGGLVDQEARPLTFQRITEAEALQALGDMRDFDPAGVLQSTAELVRGAECFRIGGAASAVYVLRVMGDSVCVEAARGSGDVDLTAVMDEAMSLQAKGYRRLIMQTRRAGLVRKLKARGWKVRGWIMDKALS